MNLASAAKFRYRAAIIEAYARMSGRRSIPKGQCFFTLGGEATPRESEYHYMTKDVGFCKPEQYVSVEHNAVIHEANSKIAGPIWLHGLVHRQFVSFLDSPAYMPPAVVNLDLMGGIKKELPFIEKVVKHLIVRNEAPPEHQTLLVVNVLLESDFLNNKGGAHLLKSPTDILAACESLKSSSIEEVDTFPYRNGRSSMETHIYIIGGKKVKRARDKARKGAMREAALKAWVTIRARREEAARKRST